MGVSDDLRCEVPLPDKRAFRSDAFQTKSLNGLRHQFTITANGRLIHHRFRPTAPMTSRDLAGNVAIWRNFEPDGDVDVEFHGDIRFGDIDTNGDYADYVARFSNGHLEWFKTYDQLTDNQRHWCNRSD